MKKTITGFIGACSLVALVACGSDGDKPTEVGTLTSSASATTTATSTTSSEAPATSSEIPTETPSVDSSAPAEVPSDPNVSSRCHGPTRRRAPTFSGTSTHTSRPSTSPERKWA